ncbi:hypothetical protein QBC35DRAFT_533310 [Podospora australis]|uniref:CFEM domain-containing protein n=1 Tax=Podospora australis TaxID=1536484 RepID=A0AAN6WU43_9PEZI|nr:hypothetical protein QBC35DRAFT_533310 [Podospora australis]
MQLPAFLLCLFMISASGSAFVTTCRDPVIKVVATTATLPEALPLTAQPCPYTTLMPLCAAECHVSAGKANGCPDPHDIVCNCNILASIQKDGAGCVLSKCGTALASTANAVATDICNHCGQVVSPVDFVEVAEATSKRPWNEVDR